MKQWDWTPKALFTYVKCYEWVLQQQVVVFTLDVCIFKNMTQRSKGNANADVTCKPGLTNVHRITDTTENITFPHTTFALGKIVAQVTRF